MFRTPKPVVVPVVGMGVTQGVGSDRYPYTIIGVSSNGKTLQIQADTYKATAKHEYFGAQDYDYFPNPHGQTLYISLRKDGRWRQIGSSSRHGSSTFGIGHRSAHQDPSF